MRSHTPLGISVLLGLLVVGCWFGGGFLLGRREGRDGDGRVFDRKLENCLQ